MSRVRFTIRLSTLQWALLTPLSLLAFACGGTVGAESGEQGLGGKSGGGGATVLPVGDGTSGSGGMSGHGATPCLAATVDEVTRLVSCENGYKHRASETTCTPPSTLIEGMAGADGTAGGATLGSSCNADADCSGLPLAYCTWHQVGLESGRCESGCLRDSDCGANALCLCIGGGRCIEATCKTDADCGSGSLCAVGDTVNCGESTFACQRADDECATSADCSSGSTCIISNARRVCRAGDCHRTFD